MSDVAQPSPCAATPGRAAPHAPAPSGSPTLVRWTHGLVNRVVATGDVLSLLLASASLLPSAGLIAAPLTPQQVVVVTVAQAWAFLTVMRWLTAYRVEHYRAPLRGAAQVLLGFLAAAFVAHLALEACLPQLDHLAPWLLEWHLLQVTLLLLHRQIQSIHVGIVDRRQVLRRRVVVIGTGAAAARVLREMRGRECGSEFEVVALFRAGDDDVVTSVEGVPVTAGLDVFPTFAQDHPVDLVVVAKPWAEAQDIFRLLPMAEWIAADVAVPFGEEEFRPGLARLMPIGGIAALQVASRPLKGTQGLLKAAEDYVVAATALLLLSPFMLIIALLIRLESPGPALFLQPRTGFNQKPFRIYKFRTMTLDPRDDGSRGTQGRDDARITRIGGVLRRLSLDELPQLINVLRGEMSVVGPRPYVPNMRVQEEPFSELVRRYAVRHRIKPGMTGWAQANGLRSAALRDPGNARRSVEMDLWYITHWSLWLDLRIMARTLATGLAGRHVY